MQPRGGLPSYQLLGSPATCDYACALIPPGFWPDAGCTVKARVMEGTSGPPTRAACYIQPKNIAASPKYSSHYKICLSTTPQMARGLEMCKTTRLVVAAGAAAG
ncbi:hypothetical protein J6590_016505 [Homalodisca vitripennis]|nr:hypothetical protein J6590_016505 [Homalodisca vitripennis]